MQVEGRSGEHATAVAAVPDRAADTRAGRPLPALSPGPAARAARALHLRGLRRRPAAAAVGGPSAARSVPADAREATIDAAGHAG